MKYIGKMFLIFTLFSLIFGMENITFAGTTTNIQGFSTQGNATIGKGGTDIGSIINAIGFDIINIVRYIFSGILFLIIIYLGARIIISMGGEDDISNAKKGLLYAIIGLIFINFPVEIYYAIKGEGGTNFFINEGLFINFINGLIQFLEILVGAIAVLVLIITGLRLITSRGREERVSEAKSKVLWVLIALVFIGFIEAYRNLIIADGGVFNVSNISDIFKPLLNFLLLMVPIVAVFFLTLAGYYYITSNGNEERVKKGKSIIINTIIGIVLLLCSFFLLNDILQIFTNITFN